ncbi:UDP-N-acetylmuramoylalanyl-D-glutamate--2,6-diaminopimelate ligase [Adlercreutzia murintestinalis]|uniref:UDP-N-acetylmuramoylalanyl-D-glutamate--2, 6-diaminopimelate ligase n=1 Tax=Adlercreutzia murintestinalis TaxID=2941325 RepID=UPI002040C14B|nr:UDP-N-acetylmuramoylalanyl-D-glutamate--2,6-diaminopimelate ligase [Adlercreutzia murintestinalis]
MQREMYSFVCPNCGSALLNLLDYESLMVLRADLGLFTMACPSCAAKTSMLRPIPPLLRDDVGTAAAEIHAGMGRKLDA